MQVYSHSHTVIINVIHLFVCCVQVATSVGLAWGGKQPVLRDSSVLEGCLGNYDLPATMYYIPRKGRGDWKGGPKWVDGPCAGAKKKDMSLKTGQKITNVFGPNDPPPWYDLNAPRYARVRTDAENDKETRRRCKARERLLEKKQSNDPIATLTSQEEETFQTTDVSKYPPIPGM